MTTSKKSKSATHISFKVHSGTTTVTAPIALITVVASEGNWPVVEVNERSYTVTNEEAEAICAALMA